MTKRWMIPHRTAEKLRKLSVPLFYTNEWSVNKKKIIFYKILNGSLDWIKKSLVELNLEINEAESEIYILCSALFDRFDKNKSSIVPYVENNIIWQASKLIKIYKNNKEIPHGLIELDESYEMNGEIYLTSPEFLFEKKWLGKHLSQSQKQLILKILTTDSLTVRSLANECRVSKSTMQSQLQNIAIVIKERL